MKHPYPHHVHPAPWLRRAQRHFVMLLLGLVMTLGSVSPYAAEDTIALNFTDTDINAVITAVAKLTGKNFIIDPRVKGKVTVITNEALSKDEVYQVFLSVLKVHGYAAVPGGDNVIKIIPDVNAKQDTIKTITRADQLRGDELVTRVIQIKYVNAAQLVPILRPLVPQRGHLAASPASNVLIISDSAGNVARLAQIISRIDQAVSDKLEVISLQHAIASDVVRIIKQLRAPGGKDKAGYTVVADDRTNSVLLGGDKAQRLRLRAIINHMDIPQEISGNTHVIYLRYAKAKDLVPVLTGISKTFGKAKGAAGKGVASALANVNIQADESTNALVINAPPKILRSLRTVVSQLDIRRAQVLIEAILAEVSYTKQTQLGVQWAFDGTSGGDNPGAVGLLNLSAIGAPLTGLLQDPPLISDGLNLGLGSYSNGTPQLAMLVSALAGDTNTNVLATPTLVTMDNEEAKIVVGQNVPILTGQYANVGGGTTPTNPFQTVERQDIGLILTLKPQINEGNSVKLEIDQEISIPVPGSEGVNLVTNKRQIVTNVLVNDGQILVLGGLIQDDLREREQKVPGLGDLPLLGWLFKYQGVEKVKTNLMIFIHPVILKDDVTTIRYTGEKYNFLRNQQLAERRDGVNLLSDDEIPVIGEFDAIPPLPPRYRSRTGYTSSADEPPRGIE
ncbi:MAG TPA: type II secretion system protein GspD [Chromatiales bacterium]|nr:type II secretion system protein GspD [Chromatiales bacterium]